MVKVIVTAPDGPERALDMAEGLSLMEGLRAAQLPVSGDCEGSLACSSCHVWIDAGWFDRLDPPDAAEEDLLDVVFNLSATSRLSCQIRLAAELDGLRLCLPEAS